MSTINTSFQAVNAQNSITKNLGINESLVAKGEGDNVRIKKLGRVGRYWTSLLSKTGLGRQAVKRENQNTINALRSILNKHGLNQTKIDTLLSAINDNQYLMQGRRSIQSADVEFILSSLSQIDDEIAATASSINDSITQATSGCSGQNREKAELAVKGMLQAITSQATSIQDISPNQLHQLAEQILPSLTGINDSMFQSEKASSLIMLLTQIENSEKAPKLEGSEQNPLPQPCKDLIALIKFKVQSQLTAISSPSVSEQRAQPRTFTSAPNITTGTSKSTTTTPTTSTSTTTTTETIKETTKETKAKPTEPKVVTEKMLSAFAKSKITRSGTTPPQGFNTLPPSTLAHINKNAFSQTTNTCFTVSVLRGIFENDALAASALERVSFNPVSREYNIRLTFNGNDFDVNVSQREFERHNLEGRPTPISALEAGIVKFMEKAANQGQLDTQFTFGRPSFSEHAAGLLGMKEAGMRALGFGDSDDVAIDLIDALNDPNKVVVYFCKNHFVSITSIDENNNVQIGNSMMGSIGLDIVANGRDSKNYSIPLEQFLREMGKINGEAEQATLHIFEMPQSA